MTAPDEQTRLVLLEERSKRLQADVTELKVNTKQEFEDLQEELTRQLDDFKKTVLAELASVKSDVGTMKTMAERWRGAFLLLTGVGGIIGWIVSLWGKVKWPS